jgi:hypothetical protein
MVPQPRSSRSREPIFRAITEADLRPASPDVTSSDTAQPPEGHSRCLREAPSRLLRSGNGAIATMGGLGGIGSTGFGGSMTLTSASFGGAAAFSAVFISAGGSRHSASRAFGASSLARARPPRALIVFAIASPCFCFMCFFIAASKGAEAPPAPRLRDLSRARTFLADRGSASLFPELTSSYAPRTSAELPRSWDQRLTTSTVRLTTSMVLPTMSERLSDDLVRTLPALDRAADDLDRAPDVPRTDIPGTRENVP